MTVARAVAAAGLSAVLEHHVADLGARADEAAVWLAVQDQTAADPCAERQHDHVARAAAGADLPLGDRRSVRVVVQRDGQGDDVCHPVAKVEIVQRDVYRAHYAA